jgi:hypothetical protein
MSLTQDKFCLERLTGLVRINDGDYNGVGKII